MERQIYSSKINPHFLFNSLNLMISLLDDKEKAEDVLIRLSELLRYNLETSKLKFIPLSRELDSIRKYLYIQKERFGKRLNYEIRGNSEREIPPLLLGNSFYRISRTDLINPDFINKLHPMFKGQYVLEMKNGDKINISRRRTQGLRDLLNLR